MQNRKTLFHTITNLESALLRSNTFSAQSTATIGFTHNTFSQTTLLQ
ncbi:MAG: hypothetical protein IKX14_06585 [Neisseriaceae bacterium]|nr:hypothetical protein [Neisseriaceae bacterium]